MIIILPNLDNASIFLPSASRGRNDRASAWQWPPRRRSRWGIAAEINIAGRGADILNATLSTQNAGPRGRRFRECDRSPEAGIGRGAARNPRPRR